MKKVVLDTNIYVSSIFWKKGNPHQIVNLAFDKKIKVYTSINILRELEKVLKRDFEQSEEKIEKQLSIILEYAEIIEAKNKLDIITEDPDDNIILEAVLESKADYIVTGDKHLLKLKNFKNIKIVTAKEFLEKC